MSQSISLPNTAFETPSLNELERVLDTFVAPSKTFSDILRSTSWWLPLVLLILSTTATNFAVQKRVGFQRSYENQLHASPRQEDRINQLPQDQRAAAIATGGRITGYFSYAVPIILVVSIALYALILWASFKFGLGAASTYAQVFSVCFYAALPYLLLSLLTIVTLFFGGQPETYDYKNPVGTNPGFYLADVSPGLRSLLGRFDLIQLWSVALTVLGMSIIAKKTITQSAVVVLGWWFVMTVLTVGSTLIFG